MHWSTNAQSVVEGFPRSLALAGRANVSFCQLRLLCLFWLATFLESRLLEITHPLWIARPSEGVICLGTLQTRLNCEHAIVINFLFLLFISGLTSRVSI